eukprot:CAMPEP_0206054862 /NCGR_PEP_ID=MMETSP1466-20131121/39035_1 /ASSEMBLY_ACC=CAM_ASM_001126 /TAXON_ID=44452 /ORGANISM="Pavlova gyrans, Strain CCMP608" /LENGTH=360 /DNA_ID=CAMNT_0053430083 /DNA_START=1 /DNA_END=1083 /DNA_ORIENTATION=+
MPPASVVVPAAEMMLHVLAAVCATTAIGRPLLTSRIDYSAANRYFRDNYEHERPFFSNDEAWEPIYDARQGVFNDDEGATQPASLDTCGFTICDAPSFVDDWSNLESVKTRYIPELERVMRKALRSEGPIRDLIFWNPMLRGEDWSPEHVAGQGYSPDRRETARSMIAAVAHLDTDMLAYDGDAHGFARLVERNSVDVLVRGQPPSGAPLGEKGHAIAHAIRGGQRFAIVNAWRNVDPSSPIRRAPLALLASRWKTEESGRPLVVPEAPPRPEASRWYVFPEMTVNEVLLFKQFDRCVDFQSDIWHCALPGVGAEEDDTTRAPPRRSFEVRALVLFDDNPVPAASDRFTGDAMPRVIRKS